MAKKLEFCYIIIHKFLIFWIITLLQNHLSSSTLSRIILLYPTLSSQITLLSYYFYYDFCYLKILIICFYKLFFGIGNKSIFCFTNQAFSITMAPQLPIFTFISKIRNILEDYLNKKSEFRKLLMNAAKYAKYLWYLADSNAKIIKRDKIKIKWLNAMKQRAIHEFCINVTEYLLHIGQKKETLLSRKLLSMTFSLILSKYIY